MPTSYTSLLGLALPVQGELTGQWGDVVNNYITQYTDASVAGRQTISGTQTAVTLTTTNGAALSQAGSGATGSAQYMIINCTGNPASLLTITVDPTPTTAGNYSKIYVVINATSTSQSVKIVGTGPTTGVTITAGNKALVAWNGSDFVKITGGPINLNSSDVTGVLQAANGGTSQSTYTTGDTIYASASNTLSKLSVGSTGQVLTVAGGVPTWQNPSVTIGPLVYNTDAVSSNTTVPTGQNAMSVGPITINSGYTVTVSSGQRWIVL